MCPLNYAWGETGRSLRSRHHSTRRCGRGWRTGPKRTGEHGCPVSCREVRVSCLVLMVLLFLAAVVGGHHCKRLLVWLVVVACCLWCRIQAGGRLPRALLNKLNVKNERICLPGWVGCNYITGTVRTCYLKWVHSSKFFFKHWASDSQPFLICDIP